MSKIANSQAGIRPSPLSGVAPPKEHQFGQPNGNKRGRGFWKKEDTARYKIEQMMKLTKEELVDIAVNKDAPYFERKIARNILKDEDWKTTESMINQAYGYPKQAIEQTNVEIQPLIDLTDRKKPEKAPKTRGKAVKPPKNGETAKNA